MTVEWSYTHEVICDDIRQRNIMHVSYIYVHTTYDIYNGAYHSAAIVGATIEVHVAGLLVK